MVFAISIGALSGCGVRGTLALMPEQAVPVREKTVLVATSRTTAPPPDFFGEARSYQTNYSRFEVSIPPEREIGEVNYPGGADVDPNTEFLVSSVSRLKNRQAFVRAINEEADQLPAGDRQGFVFVHGFNTNSAEAVIRATALAEDTGRKGVELVYSWPSAGSVLKYLDDRESALFARDSFKETLTAMSESRLTNYLVVAHSMGTFVAMDTMRELAQQNRTPVLGKVRAVVLISADLDIDVFRKQATPVLAQGVPIVLLTTNDDLALSLSAKLRRQGDRVGDIKSMSELGGLQVAVFDLTDVQSGDPLKHFKIGSSPEILRFLKTLNEKGQGVISDEATGRVITIDAATLEGQTGVTLSQ
jgi:esterase/lipase superfamily enzyme